MLRLPAFIAAHGAAGRRNFAYKTKTPETHYEVLNVKSDCSKQDIRNAYLKLSKQYHPDVKSNAASVEKTARFVKITEAYQTLVKTSTRKDYDDSLIWYPGGARETIQPWDVRPNYNPNPGPYYGIKGMNRVSNWQVALFLMSLGILGAIFGFSSVKSKTQNSVNLGNVSSYLKCENLGADLFSLCCQIRLMHVKNDKKSNYTKYNTKSNNN
ncbi:dnaJ-like protein 60 isoform X3 [Drosophila virilis]|uniref:dnaJ-like protein 60 isoform X3 n=1 Tax=Drosophila virilis TaxID=7244 RepID=UPI0038B387B8